MMDEPPQESVFAFLDARYNEGWDIHNAGPCLEIRFGVGRYEANRMLMSYFNHCESGNPRINLGE